MHDLEYLSDVILKFQRFLYAMIFYVKRMEVEGYTNLVLYVGYTAIMTFLFWLLTGTAGFFGCFAFVRKIYSVVKVRFF